MKKTLPFTCFPFKNTFARKLQQRLYLVSLLTCSLATTGTLAQTLTKGRWAAGLSAGYTQNEFYTNISNYDYNFYKKGSGFVVSAPVQFAVTDWFALQIEPGFIQKCFSLGQNLPTEPETQLTSRYNYLQLPLMLRFSFGAGRWRGFVNGGIYGTYWLSGRAKGTVLNGFEYNVIPVFSNLPQDVDGKYEFDSRRDRRLQAGWLAGGGLQYNLSKRLALFAEGRYYSDLTDQQKQYMRNQVPRYNLTATATAGFLIGL